MSNIHHGLPSSPPDSPKSDKNRSPSPEERGSPITPQSKERPGMPTYNQMSGSNLETPNEKRNHATGKAKKSAAKPIEQVMLINGEEVTLAQIDQFFREHYESRIAECEGLKSENKRLRQAPGQEYLLSLENDLHNLAEINEKFKTDNARLTREARIAESKSEKSRLEINKLQEELTEQKTTFKDRPEAEHDNRLQKAFEELSRARTENEDLYDRCMILQQENDELKSNGAQGGDAVERLKLVRLNKEMISSEADRTSIKTELVRLSDQLDAQIESRMLVEGSGFFDQTQSDTQLEEMEELKVTIRTQQDEIEALRKGDHHHEPRLTQINEEDEEDEALSPSSSLGDELGQRIDELAQQLEQSKQQLHLQEAYSAALKDFKHRAEQDTTGDAVADFSGKMQQLDALVIGLNNKIQGLQRQLEDLKARLHEQGIVDDSIDAEDLVEHVHDVLKDCGKMVILTNDIQAVNARAKQDLMDGWEHLQEDDTMEILEELTDPTRHQVENHDGDEETELSNPVQQDNNGDSGWSIAAVGKMLDRLWINLNEGVTDEDDDLVWPSTAIPSPTKVDQKHTTPRALSVSHTAPPITTTAWTEMISMGNTYWTEVALNDRIIWIKISGPRWWSLIVQILAFLFLNGITLAWWCITTASAERQLWMDANELSFRKYQLTSPWGAERGFSWKLAYGLGYF